ncbi:hypothetical protein RJD40_21100 [Vibrio scophthalmi]|uniref:hypothetical protein n=1 Tax=Vibrio scophthalmi TaxID=45658 RepID=UPI003AAB96C3
MKINPLVEKSAQELINMMEASLSEVRISLLKIDDSKLLRNLIKIQKSNVENVYIEFNGVSDEKIARLRDLKKEYLLLFSLYE